MTVTDEQHDSDCAIHNEPAMPKGPCDCSVRLSAAFREIDDCWGARRTFREHIDRLEAQLAALQRDHAAVVAQRPYRVYALCDRHIPIGHFPSQVPELANPPIETVCPWCQKSALAQPDAAHLRPIGPLPGEVS